VVEIAAAMDTTTTHIDNVISNKEQFTSEDLNAYLKYSGLRFWEFAIRVIPLEHLTPKARDRVLLCKELSEHIKKKKI